MCRKNLLQGLHRKGARPLYEGLGCLVLFFALLPGSLAAVEHALWPVVAVCWLLQAHFGHSALLAFHEAAHFVLHPSRRVNELFGMAIGATILTPVSAFRWVHNQHHLHLGTERDTELWPYIDPSAPRWARRLAAVGELLFGFFYTPVIFLRGVLVAKNMPRHTARRLVVEYVLCLAWWGTALAAVGYFGLWVEFVVGYFVPSVIAGNLQSLRKFTEHMGLLGDDVPSTTRTVVDPSRFGRLLSASMLHIDLHGTHHRYSKIPHFHLPEATPVVYERELREPERANVFRSYVAAIWDALKSLGDPKVGAQWVRKRAPCTGRDEAVPLVR